MPKIDHPVAIWDVGRWSGHTGKSYCPFCKKREEAGKGQRQKDREATNNDVDDVKARKGHGHSNHTRIR